MNYEEKYNEALKVIEGFYNVVRYQSSTDALFASQTIEKAFPELKESEDERIRKWLINLLSKMQYHHCDDEMEMGNKAITWLEKQGEQKPANKVEPKFKIGEWITNGEYTWKVIDIKPLDYLLQAQNGDVAGDTISYVDEEFHLCTIEDAKDGDILMANVPFIFNGNLKCGIGCPGAHCAITKLGKFQIPKHQEHWNGHTTTPATKEQRELLFQKMKEAGYEWDANKKELKIIDWSKYIKYEPNSPSITKESTWSEEDDYVYNEILKRVADKKLYEHDLEYIYTWLKSLKDRVQPQPNQEWSEEDERMISLLIKIFEVNHHNEHFKVNPIGTTDMEAISTKEIVDWLKSLKPQPKQEWSEEDEKRVNSIISSIEYCSEQYPDRKEYAKDINWLKSLNPQSKLEWSEEDEKIYSLIYSAIKNDTQIASPSNKKDAIDWLKSIKDRVQPKQEWSEEDERIRQCLIKDQENALDDVRNDKYGNSEIISDLKEMYRERIDWLKSIKPQKHWKPTEEQMQALFEAKLASTKNREYFLGLLYEDLKNLNYVEKDV